MAKRTWMLAAGAAYLGWRLIRRKMVDDLSGDVALVTGGSRGLGLCLARALSTEGCRVAICARDGAELERARQDLIARGATVLAIRCDVSDPAQVERMVADVTAHYGRIDILVNNAGIIQVGPLETMTVRDFEEIMAINFMGCVYTALAVIPQMRRRRHGRIVTIDSIGGRVAPPHLIPYDASKFALRGFSEGLFAELSEQGIAVTTILPGLMRTGSPVNAHFKGKKALEYTWFSVADSLPLITMSAESAATRIIQAIRRREPELTLGLPAQVLGLMHDLFPGFTLRVMSLVNRLLPHADGSGPEAARGMNLATPLSPSLLTATMNDAAQDLNQFGGKPVPSREHARRLGLYQP